MEKNEFYYKKVYWVGASLCSTKEIDINVDIYGQHELGFNFCSAHSAILPHVPTYNKGRFSNGKVIPELVKELMPELPLSDEDNVSYPGAATSINYVDAFGKNIIKRKVFESGMVKEIHSLHITSSHCSQNDLYKKVIDKEKKNPSIGPKAIVSWGGGSGNDALCLPHFVGDNLPWNEKIFSNGDVLKYQKAWDNISEEGGRSLAQSFRYICDNTDIRNFIVSAPMPVHLSPLFTSVKNKFAHIEGLSSFIDSMSTTYKLSITKHLDAFKVEMADQGRDVNIVFIKTPHPDLLNLEPQSWLDDYKASEHKEFNLSQASAGEKYNLHYNYDFYDDVHSTEKGSRPFAKYFVEKWKKLDPNLQSYQSIRQ